MKAELADEATEAEPVRKPRRSTRPRADDEEDATPYGVNTADSQADARRPADFEPSADEMKLLDRRDAPKPPKRVWSAELFAFLGQPGTISALMIVCAMGGVAGVMVRIARQFNPAAGGD